MISAFDAYRDADARKLMVDYVMASRTVDAPRAVAALRELGHIGLAYLYGDATATHGAMRVEYDPCEVPR